MQEPIEKQETDSLLDRIRGEVFTARWQEGYDIVWGYATSATTLFITLYWMGFRQARVPYHRRARRRGASKWPLGKRVKAALDVITGFSYLPLRLSSYLGLLVSSVAFLGAGIVLYDRLVLGIGEWGWPSLMVTMLFLGGVQMLLLGTLGEYLWRISNEVRGRPQYIVMEEFGLEERSRRSPEAER